jgi:hypothetical protein
MTTVWFCLKRGAEPISITLPGSISACLYWDKLQAGGFHMWSTRPEPYAKVAQWGAADEVSAPPLVLNVG